MQFPRPEGGHANAPFALIVAASPLSAGILVNNGECHPKLLGPSIGAAAGNPGAGAAIGGATGLLGGTAVGTNNAAASEFDQQTRYNIAYSQCMYAFGNTVTNPPVAYAFGGPLWYDWGAPGSVGGGIVFSRGPGFAFDHFHLDFHGGGFL